MVRYGELDAEDPFWLFVLVKVTHLLLTISSAGNIIIYSLKVITVTTTVYSTVWNRRVQYRIIEYCTSTGHVL